VHVRVFTVLRIGHERTPLEPRRRPRQRSKTGFERDRGRHPRPRHERCDRGLGSIEPTHSVCVVPMLEAPPEATPLTAPTFSTTFPGPWLYRSGLAGSAPDATSRHEYATL
jgi:hypothetical protein